MWLLLFLSFSIFYLLYSIYKRKILDYWSSKGFLSVGSELIGNPLLNILNQTLILEVDGPIYKKSKELKIPYIGFFEYLTQPSLLISDLNLVNKIFIKDFGSFVNRRPFFNYERDKDILIARTLFFMESEPWKHGRATLSPLFTTGKLRRLFKLSEDSTQQFIKYVDMKLKNSSEIEIINLFEKFVSDVIAKTVLGLDAQLFASEQPIFQTMAKRMQINPDIKLMVTILTRLLAPGLATALRLDVSDRTAVKFLTGVILDSIRKRESNTGVKYDDFLQLLIEARNKFNNLTSTSSGTNNEDADAEELKNSGPVDREMLEDNNFIVAQCILFVLAGTDTSGSLLSFVAYNLAVHQEIQEKLYEELQSAWESNDGQFTYENITQMEYLDQVTNETLRLNPPVPRTERRTTVDYKIEGTDLIIPKDTIVAIPMYFIHRDEDYYPNPEKFDPTRFSTEEKSKRSPYAFMPFGHGPRNCIGMRLALLFSKLAIANLVRNYIIEPGPRSQIPIKMGKVTLFSGSRPEGGKMYLQLRKRT